MHYITQHDIYCVWPMLLSEAVYHNVLFQTTSEVRTSYLRLPSCGLKVFQVHDAKSEQKDLWTRMSFTHLTHLQIHPTPFIWMLPSDNCSLMKSGSMVILINWFQTGFRFSKKVFQHQPELIFLDTSAEYKWSRIQSNIRYWYRHCCWTSTP